MLSHGACHPGLIGHSHRALDTQPTKIERYKGVNKRPRAGAFRELRSVRPYAGFFGAAFFTAAFLTGALAAGLAAVLAAVDFTAAFDFGECGRVLPWLAA